ncbi:MAG: DNA polymerase I [Oligoflexia bacterium]|nr:DNA polymerase I [Oligoflexia bacterium]
MNDNKNIFIIDGSSYIFRAFFGIPHLTNSKGFPTNAIWGFLKMIKSLLKTHAPQYVIIALDAHGDNFRKKIYPEYKANREQTPEDLVTQIPYIDRLISGIGIFSERIPGVEADDIIATYTRLAEKNGFRVTIVSGDKDLLQLVDNSVSMLDTLQDKKYGIRTVVEKYGVEPGLFTDYLAITGDTSDNVPGVRGIGPKGAAKLLKEFGSVENIYKNIEKVKNPRHRQALIADSDNAALSKKLVTLKDDMDLEFDIDRFRVGAHNNDELKELFLQLEFISEIKNWDIDLNPKKEKRAIPENSEFNIIDELTVESGGELIGHDLLERIEFKKLKKYDKIFDTKLAAHILAPGKRDYPIEDLSILYTGSKFDIGKMVGIRNRLVEDLVTNNLAQAYFEVDLPCIPVLRDMQETGCLVDIHKLEKLLEEFTDSIEKYTADIYKSAGGEFNINSPKQLSYVLFEKLNLPVTKKTSSGYSTTSQDVLETLAGLHDLPGLIMEYRELAKLKGTYIEPLLAEAKSGDSRIRTRYHLDITSTGRLSSSDPNLQNIPVRTATGAQIREVFISPPEKLLISADYSQIELRIFAHLSDDRLMMESFKNNEDIHARTASEIFEVNIDLVTPEQRRQAKAVNFGILYGKTPFGLAKELGIPQNIASKIIKRYFERYQGIARIRTDLIEKARKLGYTQTMFGRKRELLDIVSKNHIKRSFAERNAINSPIQGTASDIMKIAMVKLWHRLYENFRDKAKIILHVHDELLIEASEKDAGNIKEIMKTEMENAVRLNVGLVVDIGGGANWREAHS